LHANAFKVSNIEISSSFELNFQKNNVIDDGFKTSFINLLSMIITTTDKKKIKNTPIINIKEMIDSFTISKEKVVDNEYFAILETTFNKKKVLKFLENKLLNSCANITGGGLEDNIKRVIPDGLSADIDLDKIKTKKIFKWLKQNNINDKEMLKTFNCGVGFCLIIKPQNLKKISKFFSKEFKPYVIGKITLGKKKIKLNGKIDWS
jgi:hypothetical protein